MAQVGAELVLTVLVVLGGERWLNALKDVFVEGFKFVVALEQQQPVENVQVVEGPFRSEQGAEVSVPAGKEHGRALLLKKGESLTTEKIWMVGVLHCDWLLSLFDKGNLMRPRMFS